MFASLRAFFFSLGGRINNQFKVQRNADAFFNAGLNWDALVLDARRRRKKILMLLLKDRWREEGEERPSCIGIVVGR